VTAVPGMYETRRQTGVKNAEMHMPTPKNVKSAFGHHNTTYEMNFFIHQQLFYPLRVCHMPIATVHEQKELRNLTNLINQV
jgi:hypothetical protein